MEVNGTQPSSTTANPESAVPNSGDSEQTVLGKIFYRLLNKMMDTAKENSNSGG